MTAACAELPLAFACGADTAVGVLGLGHPAARTAVVIVVGGPQYRAGSHRQFVALARRIADAGWPVLRFDVRGMGDSSGAHRSFDDLDDDIQAAIGAVQRARPAVDRIVLWGLCDGASAALLYVQRRADARVAGLALLNPWVRSDASLARTHVRHYYLQRLMEPSFWAKLLQGGVGRRALGDLLGSLHKLLPGRPSGQPALHLAMPFQQRMVLGWAGFRGDILLLISENDLTAHEFVDATRSDPHWRQALRRKPARTVQLPGADHTCSDPVAARAAETATLEWLAALRQPDAGTVANAANAANTANAR